MDRKHAIKKFFRIMEQDPTQAWANHLNYLQTSLLNFSDKETEFNANMVYDMYTELNRFEDSEGRPGERSKGLPCTDGSGLMTSGCSRRSRPRWAAS